MQKTQWLKAEMQSFFVCLEYSVVNQKTISGKAAVVCITDWKQLKYSSR